MIQMGLQGTDDPNSFLIFSPTTQHHQKGNHGSYFSASNGCLSNRVTDSEAQASHFIPFCLWSFTLFPELCHLLKQSDTGSLSLNTVPLGRKKTSWKNYKERTIFPIISFKSPSTQIPSSHTPSYTQASVPFAGNEMLWILFTLNKVFTSHFLYLSFLL